MAHPATYSDEWLKEYCDDNGTMEAVEKLDFDKIQNPATKALFEKAGRAWIELDEGAANIERHFGLQK